MVEAGAEEGGREEGVEEEREEEGDGRVRRERRLEEAMGGGCVRLSWPRARVT